MKCGSARLTIGDVVKERVERCKDPQESGFERFVGLEHLDTGRLEVIRFGSTNDVTTGCKICRKGDILFGRRNPYLRRASIVNFDATCSGDIIVLIPDESKILQDYLPILLTSKIFWKKAMSSQGGTMSKRIQMEDLASYEFTLPECKIQRKIVDLIWSIEKQINLMNKQICDLNLLIKSRFIEMFGDPIQNPKRWRKEKLRNLLLIERGGSPRPIDAFITDDKNGLNWIKIGDAKDGSYYIDSVKEKIKPEGLKKTREVVPGDLLLSNSMSFGKPYIMKISGCIHDGWLVLRDSNNHFNKLFLCIALGYPSVMQAFKGSARGAVVNNLNKDLVGAIDFIVPPIELQNQFIDFVEQVDKSKYNLQSYIEELTSMQISLINNPGVSGNEAE